MNIYLFLDRLYKYELSTDVFGSFSFDPDADEESKLINVEAENNNWVLYETSDVKIMFDGVPHPRTILTPNSFYVLQRDNRQYLLYVESSSFIDIHAYSFDNRINLNIGYDDKCNVKFNLPYLTNKTINIKYNDKGELYLTNKGGAFVYINNNYLKEPSVKINLGDEINVYNFKFIFLNNVLLLKSMSSFMNVNLKNSGLSIYNMPLPEAPKDEKIKDKNLYDRNDYFSKSPRFRRKIESEKVKFADPPGEDKEETPLLLTLGPMFTMGIVSCTTFADTLSKVQSGIQTMEQARPQLISSGAMLASSLLWPLITQLYNKIKKKIKTKINQRKYKKYLEEKKAQIEEIASLQKSILEENFMSLKEVEKIALNKSFSLWDRRIDQDDLLTVRVGFGDQKLEAEIEFPETEFDPEQSKMKKRAEKMVKEHKYIKDVPIGYSFSEHKITDIVGDYKLCKTFVDNVLLQLLTFYNYDDLKICVFTNQKNKDGWSYLRYLNHTFLNDKSVRFFVTESDDAKSITDFLMQELQMRMASYEAEAPMNKPYYVIVTDDYDSIKRYDFVKTLTELNINLGYSFIIIENKLGKLPSKCDNFISVNSNESSILTNAFEKQEKISFKTELDESIDMMDIARSLANIPVEVAGGVSVLPNSINFLEMEKVGKVEQLNILNRWKDNDATQTLKAEVGVDENGEYIYLDLHEKFHGPHGLIAGTTGSGKSEFIITYILSLSMNYSPDDVAFILIDYKGGGLAYAFENKTTNTVLPHLAGTITNLDKAEMHRTLVSIDSEVKRRQQIFNEARDKCGESTIDIYKYQKLYNEGKISEPCPHLFIICDEFAELKSQQPEFMQNLISVARIGRSLGVHLILATQKPSGVVDDQIWSNTKFRVCLKVADESDSKEMIKKPDAAALKQAGRFYLQVGMDEIFVLGQSGWCGAKYYPSDKILKQVDKSVSVLNDIGIPIKSIQIGGGQAKAEAQGEQLAAIMKNIIDVSDKVQKRARKLWLDNIPKVITYDDTANKYNNINEEYSVLLGEYDAPEKQIQGPMVYNFLENGNTGIYGSDGSEKENFIGTLLYTTSLKYTPEDISFYIIDYGSESLRRYASLPHIGGMVFQGENEKYSNLLKLINDTKTERKKLFVDYGGEYKNYIKNSGNKLPIMVIIINGFDVIWETDTDAYDIYSEMIKDSERYGIVYLLSTNGMLNSKVSDLLNYNVCFKLNSPDLYKEIFNYRGNINLADTFGRGLFMDDIVHEFQTLSITEDPDQLNEYLINYIKNYKEKTTSYAKRIPTLPDVVDYEFIEHAINTINEIPIGVYRHGLEIAKYDFFQNVGTIVSANKIGVLSNFVNSLIKEFITLKSNIIILDSIGDIKVDANGNGNVSLFRSNFDSIIQKYTEYVQKLIDNKATAKGVMVLYGLDKIVSKLENTFNLTTLFELLKKYENISVIVVEDKNKIKKYVYEPWYTNTFVQSDGIWLGSGVVDQNVFQLSNIEKYMSAQIKNNMGYCLMDGFPQLIKVIEFNEYGDKDDE